ncbi:MAG: TlpA disulfide reductase family protein, partial [Candidatus Thermoplasmatota archaeon]
MATKKCPVCGVPVKVENLERHLRNQHPRADVDLTSALTEQERREAQRAKAAARPAITTKGMRWVAIIAVVVAVILILAIWNPLRGIGPGVGQVAPDFTVETSTVGTVTLSSYRESPVVLELMDVDCSACQLEARDVLPFVFQNYSGRGVRFLSVSLIGFVPPADTKATIEGFKSKYGTNWAYGMDTSGTVRNAYQVQYTPTT